MDITEKDRIDEKGKKAEGSTLTEEQFCILYAMCHVTSMASACANPVIYGYLNENFNREFKDILQSFRKCMGLDKLGRYVLQPKFFDIKSNSPAVSYLKANVGINQKEKKGRFVLAANN